MSDPLPEGSNEQTPTDVSFVDAFACAVDGHIQNVTRALCDCGSEIFVNDLCDCGELGYEYWGCPDCGVMIPRTAKTETWQSDGER